MDAWANKLPASSAQPKPLNKGVGMQLIREAFLVFYGGQEHDCLLLIISKVKTYQFENSTRKSET